MKTLKFIAGIVILLVCFDLNEASGQWATSGTDIYNTNTGNVGIGNASPATLLYVAKNMAEPMITVRNLGGVGGATYSMVDNASGANWKFKATQNGGFKIRDHANGLDVLVIEANSADNALYIGSGGSIGIGTTPNSESSVHVSTPLPIIFPSMTQAQIDAIVSPVEGMVLFNTDLQKLQVYVEALIEVYGNNTVGSSSTCLQSGPLWFIPPIDGQITQVKFHAPYPGETASLAVKTDFCTTPLLIGTSNTLTMAAGWNTWTFTTPVAVTAGITYYITSDDANMCLGVNWSGSGDDPTTGRVDPPCTYNNFDPACQITIEVPNAGWVDLH